MLIGNGCAQISAPTGGPKDTIPPKLVTASPPLNTVNFKGNKITFSFDEYIEVQDIQSNVIISPVLKNIPTINYKLKTITVNFKETLLPATTYTVNFGNAIKDINEGNVLNDFTYVFSTGNMLDTLTLSGKIIVAETGKTDSTIVALLYRNVDDSAVFKRKPDYIARPHADGSFIFYHLPNDKFRLYALKDGDGNKYYSAKTELFAFHNTAITVSDKNEAVTLYAYAEQKENRGAPSSRTVLPEKKLRFSTNLSNNQQDLLNDLEITFNNSLKIAETSKIILTDTNFNAITNSNIALDSTHRKIIVKNKWKPASAYKLIINKEAVADSANHVLTKTDTLSFVAKKEIDYGNITLRFNSLNFSQNPVLQFVQNDELKMSYKLTSKEWSVKLFPPGEYEIRILLDDNNNGKWDPGSYSKKIQPEKVISIDQKISIKANWDNERDIQL